MMQPDMPRDPEEIEEEHAINLMRGLIAQQPDIDNLLNGNVVFSSRGRYGFCMGTSNLAMLEKIGFQA